MPVPCYSSFCMWLTKIAQKIWLLLGFITTQGCGAAYVMKQGYYQLEMVRTSRPIEKVLKKDNLTPKQRQTLELVLEIRRFAQEHLSLTVGKNYTTVNLKWNIHLYNVSACEALAFKPYVWWFPIVGYVPYLGFFSEQDAQKQQQELVAKGYDTMVYVVPGYSTLGYFNDPILPDMLNMRESALIEMLIHELAHATVYFASQTDFNESFANFVGRQGAILFYQAKYGIESDAYQNLMMLYRDEKRYGHFMWQLYQSLNHVYESSSSQEEKHHKKKELLEVAQRQLKTVGFETQSYRSISLEHTNNAALLSFKRYNTDQGEFMSLFRASGEDFKTFIEEMKKFAKAEDPLRALRERLKRDA